MTQLPALTTQQKCEPGIHKDAGVANSNVCNRVAPETHRKISTQPFRVLEFFCGIGCMHHALFLAGLRGNDVNGGQDLAVVVESFDINDVCGSIYKHNFGHEPCRSSIVSLTENKLRQYNADTWMLSPPCQPYTRTGSQRNAADARAGPLSHICSLIPKLKPKRLFVENVVGFEQSDSRDELIASLLGTNNGSSSDYHFVETIVSPTELGIPNERPRYYLLAWRADCDDIPFELITKMKLFSTSTPLNRNVAWSSSELHESDYNDKKLIPQVCYNIFSNDGVLKPLYKGLTVADFLENCGCDCSKDKEDSVTCSIPSTLSPFPNCLRKRRKMIAEPSDTTTNCFTKAYGHHAWGSGSFLRVSDNEHLATNHVYIDIDQDSGVKSRVFSPTEVARLLGLPVFKSPINSSGKFEFPNTLTDLQKWRALGNSMSVVVVSELFRILFARA